MSWDSEGQRLLSGIVQRGKQREVAHRCHVRPATVCRWLHGQRKPVQLRHRRALAELGIPMDDWDRAPTDPAATSTASAA